VQQLEVKLGKRAYPILIGPGLLGSKELLARHARAAKLLVVTDEAVGPLWLPKLEAGLDGREYATCVLPGGEQQKTLGNVSAIIDALVAARVNRDGAVLALGGGVIGDIAGFAAASYQRGIAIVQLPTTLLAQVDSAVGGKTGVNHPGGKNLIGAFHQPSAVISDTDTLSTLPERELRAGFAEVVKAALVADAGFFAWLEANGTRVIAREPAAIGARCSTSATPSGMRSKPARATGTSCTERPSQPGSHWRRSCPRAPGASRRATPRACARSCPPRDSRPTRRASGAHGCSS
jgi:3-dehydroquinate synthetase